MHTIENNWWKAPLFVALSAGLLACGDLDEENQNQEQEQQEETTGIEVAGTWETQFESIEVIDEEQWSFMNLVEYDNEARRAVTQNPADDEFNPSAYNLLVWTALDADEFHYCTAAFGLETEEEARDMVSEADAENLDGGCGGFSWTHMVRQ